MLSPDRERTFEGITPSQVSCFVYCQLVKRGVRNQSHFDFGTTVARRQPLHSRQGSECVQYGVCGIKIKERRYPTELTPNFSTKYIDGKRK